MAVCCGVSRPVTLRHHSPCVVVTTRPLATCRIPRRLDELNAECGTTATEAEADAEAP